MQELHWLSEKVDVLLRKYAALKAENRGLKETVARQEEQLSHLRQELHDSEERMMAVEVAALLPEGPEREKVRRQLDAVIGEIDKILTTLND